MIIVLKVVSVSAKKLKITIENQKKSIIAPSRFQPPRSTKTTTMTHQQLLQQEQQRREEAERQANELSSALAELRQQFQAMQAERSNEAQSNREFLARVQHERESWINERRLLLDKLAAEQATAAAATAAAERAAAAAAAAAASAVTEQAAAATAAAATAGTEQGTGAASTPTQDQSNSMVTAEATHRNSIGILTANNNQENRHDANGSGFSPVADNRAMYSQLNRTPTGSMSDAGTILSDLQQVLRRVPLSVSMEQLQKYSADSPTQSVRAWIVRVDEDATIHAWSPVEKFIAAKRALIGTARKWLDGQKGIISWEELKTRMIESFGKRVKSSDIHEALSKRKRRRDETILAYVQEMELLASQANLDEDEIRQYIVNGVTDDQSIKLTLIGASSRLRFMELLESHEKMKARESEEHNQRRHHHRQGTKRCYNCNKYGHLRKDCTEATLEATRPGLGQSGVQERPSNFKEGLKANSRNFVQYKGKTQNNSAPKINHVQYKSGNRSRITAYIGGIIENCQVDSGADRNVMREDFYKRIEDRFPLNGEQGTLSGAGGLIRTLGSVRIPTVINGTEYILKYTVVPEENLPSRILLGDPILDVARVFLSKEGPQIEPIIGNDFVQLIEEELSEAKDGVRQAIIKVPEARREQIRQLLENYSANMPPQTSVKMSIRLKNTQPIACRPRRLSPADEVDVKKQLEEWTKKGVVVPGISEYASAIVVARRKDGRARICIDYKPLNKVVEREQQPMRLIEDAVDSVANSVVHSTLDLQDGFFHVEVSEESQKYLSFVTPWGQYIPKRAPFGFCNSPAAFQRFILNVFQELINEGIMEIYVDDAFVKAEDEDQAVERLARVLEVAQKNGIQFNWKKSQLLQRKVEFLGYIVEKGTITPGPAKMEALLNYPQPRTTKQLQRLLGLTGYFRKFVKGYATIAKPLSNLLRKDATFKWGPEQEKAFLQLKHVLTSEPLLQLYRPNRETELHTDASKDGYGAILLQKCPEDNAFHPVYYMSRKTTPTERNYHSYELETLAIVRALEKFRINLQGIKFKIVTDCSALQMTLNNKELKTKFARWIMFLELFDFKIEHRSAQRMQHVDALSRQDSILLIHDPLLDRIKRAQQHDEKLQLIRKLLNVGPYKNYTLDNDLLYEKKSEKLLLVVPKGMRYDIIRQAHDIGHFGTKKTMEKLQEEFAFENMKKHVDHYINNCVTCILASRKKGKQEELLKPIPKEEAPFHTWHIDHVGPLPSTNKNYKYLFVIVDAFTKYTWIFATKTKGTKEALGKLSILQQHFCTPTRIIADRARGFDSKDFDEFCEENKIDLHLITTGMSRGNSQVERVIQVANAVFSKVSLGQPNKWYKFIRRVQHAINGTHHRSINATPFELMFGAKLRMPEDMEIIKYIEEAKQERFIDTRSELRKRAVEQIKKTQAENSKNFNKNRRPPTKYSVGDIVAIRRTQRGPGLKIAIKFLGPYKVVRVKDSDRYEVERIGEVEGPILTTTGADYMKPWRGFADDLEPDDDEEDEGEHSISVDREIA